MGEVKLAPCPFCGATDGRLLQAFTRATNDFAFWSVECLDCGVEVADDSSQEAADRAWNTRTPSLQSKLDRATEALEKARDLIDCIKQTPNNLWWVEADDPETAVCDTHEAVSATLSFIKEQQ